MKKSKVGILLSLTAMINSTALLPAMSAGGSGSQTSVMAQATPDAVGGKTASEAAGTTGSSSSKVDTEHWPWMEQETPKQRWDGLKSEMPLPSTTSTPAPPSSTIKMEKPVLDPEKLMAPPAPLKPVAGLKPERPQTATVTTNAAAASTEKRQPIRLYGRIEQIERGGAPAFPIVLKAQTAKMDTRQVRPLQASASEFSGRAVSSFPQDYSGNWGGQLQVQQVQADARYYQVDRAEAERTLQALRIGLMGNANFQFQGLGSRKISLEPVNVLFMVPSKDTMQGDQMKQMLGQSGAGGFAGMLGQMMQGMNVPVLLSYGDTESQRGVAEGVSGNQFSVHVIKNDIRELAPGVLEQDIVAQKRTTEAKTGTVRNGFDETVMRFTSRNPQQMYVQAASVNYDANKHFLMKSVLGGWITKGQVVNTNPMSALGGGMGGLGGAGGIDLNKLLAPGAGSGQPGQMPQIPGLDPNMLKNLLGQ